MFGAWFGAWQVVKEGQAGLLYRDGVFVRTLPPGRHRVGLRERLLIVATAVQTAVVSGQEVASADGFQPKLSAVVEFAVVDPHRAAARLDGAVPALLIEVGLALRGLALGRPAEALVQLPREELDAALLAAVAPSAGALGIRVDRVRLRDVILPADLRRLLTGVEKARREGQAALERAHAEQAALRALANAARMLKSNPELQNLRLLQALGSTPTTLVLGTPAGIVPLREPDQPLPR